MNLSISEPVSRAPSPEVPDFNHVVLDLNLEAATGFDLCTHRGAGQQFGVITACGRIRWHIDGVLADPTLCILRSTRTVQMRVVA